MKNISDERVAALLEDPALDLAEQQYRAIFEAVSDGLMINDLETGLVLAANPAACRMHGYDDMAGMQPITFIHPNSHHLFREYVEVLKAGGEYRCFAQDIRKDGTVFDIEVLGRMMVYNGRPATLGVVRDVTDRVRAQQILEERVAERTVEIERRQRVAEGLRELLEVVNRGRSLDEILAHIAQQARSLLSSGGCAIYLPVEGGAAQGLRIHASTGIDEEYASVVLPVGAGATGLAFKVGRPVAIYDPGTIGSDDLPPDPGVEFEDRGSHLHILRQAFNQAPAYGEDDASRRVRTQGATAIGYRATLAVPLVRNEQSLGTLTLYYPESREFADDEVNLAATFAGQAALAIENGRLHEEADQRLRELEALYRAGEALHRSLRLEDVLQALVDVAQRMLGADTIAVWARDPEPPRRFTARATYGLDDDYLAEVEAMPLSIQPEWWSTKSYEAGDVSEATDLSPEIRGILLRVCRAVLRTPIERDGQIFGSFTAGFRERRTFRESERRILAALARQAALAIENARLHQQADQRLREIEALYNADEALHRSLRLEDVLQALVDVARDITGADKLGVWVRDPFGPEEVRASATYGLDDAFLSEVDGILEDPQIPRWWSTPTAAYEDIGLATEVPAPIRQLLRRVCRGFLRTPIQSGDRVFGTFTIGYDEPREFTEGEHRMLEALAGRAALAIENARLYDQAQQAATLEERQRLARELHDAVTQTLFSSVLVGDVLAETWEADPTGARARLDDLRKLTRGALAEMRTLLIELRPWALTEVPLGDLLRQLAEASAGRASASVTVAVEGPRHTRLPADAQVALYRIAQEALNNVIKHSRASEAAIRLEYTPAGGVALEVWDNGRGFELAAVPAGHLGTSIMRERAEAAGAAFILESAPGEGTRVAVAWHPDSLA
jgi:PAS domain S-box-containing protein